MITPQDVVATARGFLGTRFHHRGRLPGVCLDCAGVIVCTARALGAVSCDFDVPEYEANPDGRTMLEWCSRYLGERRESAASIRAADVLVIRIRQLPQHLALVTDYAWATGVHAIVHASALPEHKKVVEQRLMFSPRQRFVAAFAFPGVQYG